MLTPTSSSEGWDRHPDDQRSLSGMWTDDAGERVRMVLKVKDYGALVLGAALEGETLVFKGLSEFSVAEIGWE